MIYLCSTLLLVVEPYPRESAPSEDSQTIMSHSLFVGFRSIRSQSVSFRAGGQSIARYDAAVTVMASSSEMVSFLWGDSVLSVVTY